jgi:hypothetical protein
MFSVLLACVAYFCALVFSVLVLICIFIALCSLSAFSAALRADSPQVRVLLVHSAAVDDNIMAVLLHSVPGCTHLTAWLLLCTLSRKISI